MFCLNKNSLGNKKKRLNNVLKMYHNIFTVLLFLPLVARTATSLQEPPQGLPHKANTHTQSPF